MSDKVLLWALALGSTLILLGFLLGSGGLDVVTAAAAFCFPVALAALGAARKGRLGRTWIPLLGLLVVLEVSLFGMLWLRGRVLEAPWVAGLPLAAALQIYVMGGLSLILVSLAFIVLHRDDSH